MSSGTGSACGDRSRQEAHGVLDVLERPDPRMSEARNQVECLTTLGQVLAPLSQGETKDVPEADRTFLLHLLGQLGQPENSADAADRPAVPLSVLSSAAEAGLICHDSPAAPSGGSGPGEPGREESHGGFGQAEPVPERHVAEYARPSLPDARIVRRIIRQRQLRARFIDEKLLADPAWDILLDLTAAHVEQARVSVTSLCIASGVALTTALRWIGEMTRAGLLERTGDKIDRRRVFISLTDKAVDAMARYFAKVEGDVAYAI